MENIFLALVTDDREYGRALGLAMLSVCRNFIISVLGTEQFLGKSHSFDLVLWDGIEAGDIYGGKLVYLAERPSDVVRNTAGRRFCIYKYSAADHMVASVFEIYEAVTGRRAVNLKRQNVRLFGFVSCTGGVGCTALASSLGQELCRFHGQRVLYLSFEEIESTGSFMQCSIGMKGAGVYLYHLFKVLRQKAGTDYIQVASLPFLDGYMVRDAFGMEAFAPTQGRNPLRDLGPEEVSVFLSSLIDSGRFDVIIMDLGPWLSKTGITCVEMAEKLCFVTSHRDNTFREEQYVSHLVSHCGEEILSRIIKTVNMKNESEKQPENKEDGLMLKDHISISRCSNVTIDGPVRRMLLEGEFGYEINGLSRRLTEAE